MSERPIESGRAAHDPPAGPLVFTRDAVREVDRRAVDQYAIPSLLLMECAAIHLARAASRLLGSPRGRRVLIACGTGNNGGDGLALARHIHNAGAHVHIVLADAPSAYRGDPAVHLAIAQRMGLPITVFDPAVAARPGDGLVPDRPDLIVDALFGTGLNGPVREPVASLIDQLNRLGAAGVPLLAVDIPSGLDADSGQPMGSACIRATMTVTFVGLKAGFERLGAQDYVGRVVVADIGAPVELVRQLGRPRAGRRRDARPLRAPQRLRPASGRPGRPPPRPPAH